jgi:hypothetical protein
MPESKTETKSEAPKTEAKASAKPKTAPKPKGRHFAFPRPNYQMAVPTGEGAKVVRVNGKSPVVTTEDPVLIEAFLESERRGIGVREVSKPLSKEVEALCAQADGKVNIEAYKQALKAAK